MTSSRIVHPLPFLVLAALALGCPPRVEPPTTPPPSPPPIVAEPELPPIPRCDVGLPYIVKKGDTLQKIARDYTGNIENWRTLAIYNGVSEADWIFPRQKLLIPECLHDESRRLTKPAVELGPAEEIKPREGAEAPAEAPVPEAAPAPARPGALASTPIEPRAFGPQKPPAIPAGSVPTATDARPPATTPERVVPPKPGGDRKDRERVKGNKRAASTPAPRATAPPTPPAVAAVVSPTSARPDSPDPERPPARPVPQAPPAHRFSTGDAVKTAADREEIVARASPSERAAVAGYLIPGDSLSVVDVSGEWVKIALPDGPSGWVRAEDLEGPSGR